MANRHHTRRERLAGGVLPLLAAGALAVVLRALYPPEWMAAWLFHPGTLAGLCWAGQLWYVWYSVETGAVGNALADALGLANAVTLARGGLYAVVAGSVVVAPAPALVWVPAVCYGLGAFLDGLDGTLARTVGEETELGARLDLAFDTFGFVAAPLAAVLWGQLPVWYLSLSAARYVFVGGLRWRRFRGRQVFALPDSDAGRYLAGVQMAFLTAALVPVLPVRPLAPFVLAPSLAVFARDFLVATGRMADPTR